MSRKKHKRDRRLEAGKLKHKPGIEFEDFAEADRVFRELLAGDEYAPRGTKEDLADDSGSGADQRSSKRRGKGSGVTHTIDLHGLTLPQATERLDTAIQVALAALQQPVTLKIVTGKGLHSGPGGGVLASAVHQYVVARYGPLIQRLDSSPAETSLGGVPLRGYFTVTFARNPGAAR